LLKIPEKGTRNISFSKTKKKKKKEKGKRDLSLEKIDFKFVLIRCMIVGLVRG